MSWELTDTGRAYSITETMPSTEKIIRHKVIAVVHKRNGELDQANARLIAHVPEMYEYLCFMAEHGEQELAPKILALIEGR